MYILLRPFREMARSFLLNRYTREASMRWAFVEYNPPKPATFWGNLKATKIRGLQ